MSSLVLAMSAWLLACMPVRYARQLVMSCGTKTNSTAAVKETGQRSYQLLVDVSVIYREDARTGIQRVVRSLLLQLLQSPPLGYEVRPIFATKKMGYHYARLNFLTESGSELSTPQLVTVVNGDVFLGLDLSAHLLPRYSAQVLGWKRAGVKVHVLVYDLLPLQHSEWFNERTFRHFKRWIHWLAVYANSAVCISETVRTELGDFLHKRFSLPYSTLPSSHISLGADICASAPSLGVPLEAESILARMRQTPSLLMVGTLEPRKGHNQVLDAFDELQKRNPSVTLGVLPLFVIVGLPGWKTEALQQRIRTHPQIGKQVFWFEDASDELLMALYGACKAVVVASRGEGFGLPLIEAAMHGKPIIARDLLVFREINLQNIFYFHDDSPKDLAMVIQTVFVTMNDIPLTTITPTLTWAQAALQLKEVMSLQSFTVQEKKSNHEHVISMGKNFKFNKRKV